MVNADYEIIVYLFELNLFYVGESIRIRTKGFFSSFLQIKKIMQAIQFNQILPSSLLEWKSFLFIGILYTYFFLYTSFLTLTF